VRTENRELEVSNLCEKELEIIAEEEQLIGDIIRFCELGILLRSY